MRHFFWILSSTFNFSIHIYLISFHQRTQAVWKLYSSYVNKILLKCTNFLYVIQKLFHVENIFKSWFIRSEKTKKKPSSFHARIPSEIGPCSLFTNCLWRSPSCLVWIFSESMSRKPKCPTTKIQGVHFDLFSAVLWCKLSGCRVTKVSGLGRNLRLLWEKG